MEKRQEIVLKKVNVHNLRSVDLRLPVGELIVFTGVSGSGKSSMAFDTIYTEGQRRYLESLSHAARRHLGDLAKPDVETILGLSPTIAIEQKSISKNPRSTVGTLTEVYDFLRVLFARVGTAHCPVSGERVTPQNKERILKTILTTQEGVRLLILAPFAHEKKGAFKDDFELFLRKGFMRAKVDGRIVDLSEPISLDKNQSHTVDIVIDRLVVKPENHSRIAEAVHLGLEIGQGVISVEEVGSKRSTLFSLHAFSAKSGLSYQSLEPNDFSFNSPSGMCEQCHGLGRTQTFELDLIIDPEKSFADDCCSIAHSYQTVYHGNVYNNLADLYDFSVKTPWKDLSEEAKNVFLYGTPKKWTLMHFVHPKKQASWSDYVAWRGVIHEAKKRYAEAKSERYRKHMERLMKEGVCTSCQGGKLKPYPLATTIGDKNIAALTALTIRQLAIFFKNLTLDKTDHLIAHELISEISTRLNFLQDVGLGYLTLDRTAPTLSGGEAQRVRLAALVGSGLVGVTYILDEPSIGLHPVDNQKLLNTLLYLRDLGNTVIVVEHDEDTIRLADRVVDFGPGPGREGGRILVNGSVSQLIETPASLTGAYLTGEKQIVLPKTRRKKQAKKLQLKGAAENNLKALDVSFPLGLFIAVTGVSGSGKSSLITDTLYPLLANHLHKADHRVGTYQGMSGLKHVDKVIAIDQTPIGRNPRSNPATYIKIFDEIRSLFAQLPDSRARGYATGRFSFNVAEGSCSECRGMGVIKIDMDFMEDEWVNCPLCLGKRFDSETLAILYKGKSIIDVLEMTASDALSFFQNIPVLKRRLELLVEVGMGYITLGQPSTTLSGGEAQRIKLAKELSRPPSGNTVYILDEPTTGLHFHDVTFLLAVLQKLVARGNTVIVIEHHMDVVKTADHVIDLGPSGGEAGGQLMGEGTPEKIASLPTATGRALKVALAPKTETKPAQPKPTKTQKQEAIVIEGASQNNLKHIDLLIPRDALTICTGPSGSGKSSLAFETLFAEGQRRYIESLSAYTRQFVKQMPKPKLTAIEGLSPTIAIEQKATAGNPRSTVGTQTEIYDYLRILFARHGTAYCPETGEQIKSITKESVCDTILNYPEGEKITLLAPIALSKSEIFEDVIGRFARLGYLRLRLNGTVYELDETIPFDKRQKNEVALVIDRLKVSPKVKGRLFETIESAATLGKNQIVVQREKEEVFFNLAFAAPSSGKSYPPITPTSFSFNSTQGMCSECQGLGVQYGANLKENDPFLQLKVAEALDLLWDQCPPVMIKMLKQQGISPKDTLSTLSDKALSFLLRGKATLSTQTGVTLTWLGIEPTLAKLAKKGHLALRAQLIPLLEEQGCAACHASRLNPLARNVRINGHSIASFCQLPIAKSLQWINELEIDDHVLDEVLTQLKARLSFLCEVGLDYMSLDRRAPTLSNGEAQRIRLARQLGSHLTGICYILDEPTTGLHPHDTKRLLGSLQKLQSLGNTLVLVEHDQTTLENADHILDFGPQAGVHGGHLVASGSYAEICRNPHSLTGAYLSGKKEIAVPQKRRKSKLCFKINGAQEHNLKNLSVEVPTQVLTCITGLSGSGKSTLMHRVIGKEINQILRGKGSTLLEGGEVFDKLITIDQNPIGHTVRSDVGTYAELLTHLRDFYASVKASKAKGLQPGHFSTNHKKGACSTCRGLGYTKVELLFLPSIKVACNACHGKRLNPVSLGITYKTVDFGALFEMTIDEAATFFDVIPRVKPIFATLQECGLGYLKLGQEMVSLSGGEAQRIKLSRELSKRTTGNTLFLIDEPTTGLHPDDIQKLLKVFHKLVDKGNTLIVIEHNGDIIKNSDHVIDLGPEAGDKGGFLVAAGTPEELAQHPTSYTGLHLRPFLNL